ncbi:unnamed protein product [Darwinula stevensoni]|uniref:Uncharacterized protein n=1 Tax=Darwinula stevensoni TaxID=69355 RepID=A0A7R9A6Z5_9CRUS|nr:unnamed protein product [Darwinula stevensoni]CAG0889482.1 unnamed protein product [Darwinula stevensoni]
MQRGQLSAFSLYLKQLLVVVLPSQGFAAFMETCPAERRARRLLGVQGFETRKNDVVYASPLVAAEGAPVIVYFGGDVQDYRENMEAHRDNRRYARWDLESTAELLSSKFPKSHVMVVKPARMELKTFSCYDNFVQFTAEITPQIGGNWNAVAHLQLLLVSAFSLLNPPISMEKQELQLIGFSKGCVVLNQLLHELHFHKTTSLQVPDVLKRVVSMTWLDGGHAGGKDTWVVQRQVLQTFAQTGIGIDVHVTPYQVQDPNRPWIGKEEKRFSETLRALGAPIRRTLHFAEESPSLHLHFQLLNDFEPSGDVSDAL